MPPLFSHHQEFENRAQAGLQAFAQTGMLVISGPTGSGKTHLARQIHQAAVGMKEPVLFQEAAALAANRFESQLFGHLKGAFSGANRPFTGLVGGVGHGSLCLEGLEELSLNNQAKMLRFMQERSYRPVGALAERPFEGKLIFTCRNDLNRLKQEGLLRADFYFRISGFELRLPDLSQRPLDFDELAETMFSQCSAQLPATPITFALKKLAGYRRRHLEGNLHGLRNLIQQWLISGQDPQPLQADPATDHGGSAELPKRGSLKADLAVLEKRLLQRALLSFPHSRRDLAEHLGVSLRSLMYKLREYDLH